MKAAMFTTPAVDVFGVAEPEPPESPFPDDGASVEGVTPGSVVVGGVSCALTVGRLPR